MKKKSCVVVGGGVVGLLASYLATKNFENVFLVERSNEIGGLLGSFERNGVIYDYGTHVPALTGIDDLDEILYGPQSERDEKYHFLPYLRSENFFMGDWNLNSPLIDARKLPAGEYQKCVIELLEAPGANDDERNLHDYLLQTFGTTLTEKIYRPVIKKLLAVELESVDRHVLTTFGLQRIIALTAEVTRRLKTLSNYDNSLGFHNYTDGSPSLPYCYPRGNQGISFWPNSLLAKAKAAGVNVLMGESVKKINLSGDYVDSLELADATLIPCDSVIWTVPPALALIAAGISPGSTPPVFRTHTLCHYEFQSPFLKDYPQYLLCWDPNMLSYRITLYPNISEDRKAFGKHNLTVEVLSDGSAEYKLDEISDVVLEELREMKIVGDDNLLIDKKIDFLGNSFPVLTKEFIESAGRLNGKVERTFSNMRLLGRASGSGFFINDLLIDAYKKLAISEGIENG